MNVIVLGKNQYEQWNRFVDQSPQGDVFCYTWWLEATTASNFKILAIFENNYIVAGIPLAYDANNKINVPPLTRTLGILYSPLPSLTKRRQSSLERKWLTALLEHIPVDNFVQMCMHHKFTDWLPFRWKGYRQTTRYTYIVDYKDKTINDLWENLDQEVRRLNRRAIESGITILLSEDCDLAYKYTALSYKRQGLTFRIPYDEIKRLDDAIKINGNRTIFKAVDNSGKVHAVLYTAFNKKSAYALLSGSDAESRKSGGHTLILWEAIKYYSDKVKYFNLCGSDIERIEAHLKGFGGDLTQYFQIYNDKLMEERSDFNFHLRKLKFHIIQILKKIMNKMVRIIRNA